MNEKSKIQLGKILLKQRLMDPSQLETLLDEQQVDHERLASKAWEKGMVDEIRLLKALSEQHGIPGINLDEVEIALTNLDIIPREIASKHLILPIASTRDAINLVMANPEDHRVIDEIEFVSGKRVFPHVALHAQLTQVINACYRAKDEGETFYRGKRFGTVENAATTPSDDDLIEPKGAGTVIEDPNGSSLELSIDVDLSEEEVSDAIQKPPPVPMPTKPAAAPQVKQKKTILVVDDEDDIRTLFTRVLKDKGYHIITAARGLEAIKKVQSETPDMIILDAMLPEIHGFDICRRIKSSSKYGHIPVIMISAIYRGWRYAQDLKNSYGVDEFIEKPFKINDLVKKVGHLMAISEGEGPPPQEELSKEAEKVLSRCVEAYRLGQIDEAIRLLKKGIEIDPLAFKLHYHLALLLGKKDLHYQAIRSLENALELAPDYFPALKNLAVLYQKTGFKFKAIETWERALGYCPEEEMREQIKTHLMNLL